MQAYMPTIAVGHNEIALACLDRFAIAIENPAGMLGASCLKHAAAGRIWAGDTSMI